MDFTPENTMASASFDIFTTDAPIDPKIKDAVATLDIEESFSLSAINFMKMQDRLLNEAKIRYYVSVSEATDITMVHESASDFFTTIKQIFDKFIKFIKSLFSKFLNTFNKLIGSDSYLKKHIDNLRAFSEDNNFTIAGFNFTFSPTIPNNSVVIDWSSNFMDDLLNNGELSGSVLGTITSADSIRDLATYDNLDIRMDAWRATILNNKAGGSGDKIYSSDFSEECFAVYRDGSLETEDIEVDSGYIIEAIRRFKNYPDMKKTVERDAKDINKQYEAARKQLDAIAKELRKAKTGSAYTRVGQDFALGTGDAKFNPGNVSVAGASAADMDLALERYINFKVNEITSITNCHALAFSSKLDAITACYKQDRNTLYTALNKTAYGNA